jgi:MFS family permease
MFRWLGDLNGRERQTLGACFGGWALDGVDITVYSFVIPSLFATWHIGAAEAGLLGSVSLLTSACGGWAAGILADRYGRVRVLQWTIVWFAVFTALSGFTNNFGELFVARALQGLGFGGEWAAGAVLISEVIRSKYRGRAAGLVQSGYAVGYAVAAILYGLIFSLVPSEYAWRAMFWVGIIPALFVIYIRLYVPEPDVYMAESKTARRSGEFLTIFKPPHLWRVFGATLLTTGALGGYWTVATWLPTLLKTVRGLSVLNTSGYVIVVTAGAFVGFLIGGYLGDRIGRRWSMMIMAFCAAALVYSYTLIPISNELMLFLGFPLGFFTQGIMGTAGAYLSELFPTNVRGSAQGFTYNAGRGIGALAPAIIGYSAAYFPLSQALGVVALCSYLIAIIGLLILPETRGSDLDAIAREPHKPWEVLPTTAFESKESRGA